MRTFTIHNDHTKESHNLKADFMTVDIVGREKKFWIKPHWYRFAQMVGFVDGSWFRVTTSTEEETSDQIAKQLGVRL